MIFTFLSLSNCFAFGPSVVEVTDKNFRKVIENRRNESVYFVMFHGENCPACRQTYPSFVEAANSGFGMVHFAHVDAGSANMLSSKFEIRSIPTFKIFHSGGETHYSGDRTTRSFLNAATKFIPNKSETVNQTWYPNPSPSIQHSAILFSNKPHAPPLWSAISCNFSSTPLRIGFSNEIQVLKAFNVTKPPVIGFVDNGIFEKYEGKLSYLDVQKAIFTKFYEIVKPTPAPTPIPPPSSHVDNLSKFEATCKSSSKYCVLETLPIQSKEFTQLSNQYKNDPLRFVNCGEKCPFQEIDKGYWIFHTKRPVAIYSSDIDGIKIELSHLISGRPSWKPLSDLLNNKDL